MDEAALRSRLVPARAEDAELIGHGAAPQPLDPQADLDRFGKGHAFEESAGIGDHQAHRVAGRRIERAAFHQMATHRRVEEGVIDHVVHVAIDIVVPPAGGDGDEGPEVPAAQPRLALARHQKARS